METLVSSGWPSDKTVFDHAAYELLKWHSVHREEYSNNFLGNPGPAGAQGNSSRSKRPDTNFVNEDVEMNVDRASLRNVSPSKRAANVLQQTSDKYPELDQAA